MNRFVEVTEGQSFAGGVLTKEGAAEVNGARHSVASGKTEPLSIKLAKAKRGTGKDQLLVYIDKDLYESDLKIYPDLPKLGK